MANTFIKPSVVARLALETLYDTTVMLPLVWQDFSEDFVQGVGDTVTIRKPATFTAKTYSQAVGIQKQDATESSTTVTLDTLLDVSVGVTPYDMSLNVTDFQRQIVRPALEAISQGVDAKILSTMSAASWASTIALSAYNASTNPHPTFDLIKAGRALTTQAVPLSDRNAVADEYIMAQWRMDELANAADKRADGGEALRNAFTGRIHGFDTYETNAINNFTGYAFHPTAVALVSRPLALPRANVNAAAATYKGLTVRVVYDYDITYKTDILSIDVLLGCKVLDTNRGVKLNGIADSV